MDFSRRLREAREARGLSQEELAQLVLLSTDALARFERGSEPKAGALADLARVLGVSADALLGVSPDVSTSAPAPASMPVDERLDLTPDMRRLMKTARKLGTRELNLVAQLADALLARQVAP
jgi:transcriptional regulator with XRE-family HTH domain